MPRQDPASGSLWTSGECLGSAFLGGIIGNLAASLLWESGKYLARPLLDKVPELSELVRLGGQDRNHDLLRVLRRAECAALVEVLNASILRHCGLDLGGRDVREALKARWRSRADPTLDTLCRLRRTFMRLHSALATMSLERLVLLNGGALADLPALVRAGSECFASDDPGLLRAKVVNDYVAWLSDVTGGPGRFAGIEPDDLAPVAPAGLPDVLVTQLHRHPGGWWDGLRLAFREELKAPENVKARTAWELDVQSRLQAQLAASFVQMSQQLDATDAALERQWRQLQAMHADFDQIGANILQGLDHIQQALGRHAVDLGRIGRHFALGDKQVFFKPGIGSSSAFVSAYKPFYFAEEEDPFLGRESVLAVLRRELLAPSPDSPRFRWAAICGDAGIGKSRLALQIVNVEQQDWPFSGFVREEFIRSVASTMSSLAEIPAPTLFVIDYAAGLPDDCCRFLERCASLAHTSPHPVRALVLLRRSSDRFFEALARQTDGAAALNSQICFPPPPDRHDDRSGALFLDGLTDEETGVLMASRLQRHADSSSSARPVPPKSPQQLLALLRGYDPSMRPLFAAMVADAYARGLLPDTASHKASQEEVRLQLFWDYLEHQYRKRWSLLHTGLDEVPGRERIDRHLSLLILSTMCRGLTPVGWERLYNNALLGPGACALLPTHPLHFDTATGASSAQMLDEEQLLAALSGAARTDENADPYPILEPDLIGESLVLMALEDRGKALCGHPGTAQRRRKLMREYAWCADPAGAAFFAVLVAQDFPERAAKLGWLLPDSAMSGATLEREQLFRNLALATVASLRTRPASLEDIQRMRELLARFPLEAAGSDAMRLMHATTIKILAGQLCFVINKSSAPPEGEGAPLADKLGKRTVTFAAAAAAGTGPATAPARDDQETMRSDAVTTAAAVPLLQQLFEQAEDGAFSSTSLEVRLEHSATIRQALFSIFWENRSRQGKHGYAPNVLTPDERKRRSRLAERSVSSIQPTVLDEDSVALAASINSALVYAEDGANSTRGRPVYEAIRALHQGPGFSKPLAMLEAVSFLDNHLILLTRSKLHEIAPSERAAKAPSLAHVWELASALFHRCLSGELSRPQLMRLTSALCRIASHLAYYEDQCQRPTLAGLTAVAQAIARTAQRPEGLPVTAAIIDLYSDLISACQLQGADVGEALSTYAHTIQSQGFDAASTNAPHWEQLARHLSLLRNLANRHGPTVQAIFEAAIAQIGERARKALTRLLLQRLPSPGPTEEINVWLVALVRQHAHTPIQWADCRQLTLALMTQRLMAGEVHAVLQELEAMWSTGTSESDFIARTDVLRLLPLLLAWLGPQDPRVQGWRERLSALLRVSETPLPPSAAVQEHHHAAVQAASSFARLEIASGHAPDTWLPQGAAP
ncbi:MAG TPA: hypothetical protein VGE36_11185 [Roseateles sp.]